MPITRNYSGYIRNSQIWVVTALIFLIGFGFRNSFVFATHECKGIEDLDEQLECYEKEESEAREDLESAREKQAEVTAKIDQYLSDLYVTQAQLEELQADINAVVAQLKQININLALTEKHLEEKLILRDSVLRAYYQSGKFTFLEFFLSHNTDLNGFSLSSLVYAYDKAVTREALEIIKRLHAEITAYETDKAEAESLQADLETNQQNLFALKANIEANKAEAESKNENLNKEIASLELKISDLSSKQQEILAAKAGSEIISGYEAASYKLPDPPFKPAFVAMSYGAYTHYNGMSQYGAKGRAEDGDDYNEILEHYYNTGVKKKDDFPSKIKVAGYGEMDFQKYLYGIAEMPSSWPDDALKAQAIAARTYAYRFAKDGKEICTTQSCQVFLKSKSDNPPSSWKDAVDDTKNKILDDPETSQYSSTTGGYLNQSGWDTDGGSWPKDAYEKKANSPWFYKAWYTQSYTDNSSTCGRDTPWLTEEEMADVLNAWVLWKNGKTDRISPITTSCWGGDPYSHSKMAEKAAEYGEEYTAVSDVWVDISNGGYTAKIHFKTNKGTVSIDGGDFKSVFNLRAPSYVAIRSRLFDMEHEN